MSNKSEFTVAEIIFMLKAKKLYEASLVIAKDMRQDRAVDNLSMLFAVATGEVISFVRIFEVVNELTSKETI